MSTDNAGDVSVPKLLGFRPTGRLVARLEEWKRVYAARNSVAADSITMQFALPYLLGIGLASEGVPNGAEPSR